MTTPITTTKNIYIWCFFGGVFCLFVCCFLLFFWREQTIGHNHFQRHAAQKYELREPIGVPLLVRSEGLPRYRALHGPNRVSRQKQGCHHLQLAGSRQSKPLRLVRRTGQMASVPRAGRGNRCEAPNTIRVFPEFRSVKRGFRRGARKAGSREVLKHRKVRAFAQCFAHARPARGVVCLVVCLSAC